MNDETIEQEIQAKGLTAPRVTPADIEANIVSEHYFTARDGRRGAVADGTYVGRERPQFGEADLAALDLLTFCVLVLRNGFTVTGESACASPENFDAEVGRKIARQNAMQKIWPLMGYELRSQLAAEARGDVNHDIGWAVRQAKLGKRVTRAGWNAAGQWVTFSPGTENVPADRFWAPANQAYAEENGGYATVFSAMTLKNAQGMIVMGWVPSVTDLLMQDWEIVE